MEKKKKRRTKVKAGHFICVHVLPHETSMDAFVEKTDMIRLFNICSVNMFYRLSQNV